jgi:hypothetical protein
MTSVRVQVDCESHDVLEGLVREVLDAAIRRVVESETAVHEQPR